MARTSSGSNALTPGPRGGGARRRRVHAQRSAPTVRARDVSPPTAVVLAPPCTPGASLMPPPNDRSDLVRSSRDALSERRRLPPPPPLPFLIAPTAVARPSCSTVSAALPKGGRRGHALPDPGRAEPAIYDIRTAGSKNIQTSAAHDGSAPGGLTLRVLYRPNVDKLAEIHMNLGPDYAERVKHLEQSEVLGPAAGAIQLGSLLALRTCAGR